MTLQYFTLFHVVISLVGIASGFGTLSGWLAGKLFPRWTACFLVSTVGTSATGFFFPIRSFTPGIGVGILSLVILGTAIYALHGRRLAGPWRNTFLLSSLGALYLNVFVLVVQLFQKVPALREIAPTQSEPAFAMTHAIIFFAFIALGFTAIRRFRDRELSM